MFHDTRNWAKDETRIMPTMLIYSMIVFGGVSGVISLLVLDQVIRRFRIRYTAKRRTR